MGDVDVEESFLIYTSSYYAPRNHGFLWDDLWKQFVEFYSYLHQIKLNSMNLKLFIYLINVSLIFVWITNKEMSQIEQVQNQLSSIKINLKICI